MHSVKGMAPVIEDPRTRKIFGLAYYTAPRGADHLSSNTNWVRDMARDSKLGQGALNRERWGTIGQGNNSVAGMGESLTVCENITAFVNSAETCARTVGSLEFIAKALSAATGIDMTEEKALQIGERIFNVEKAFNSREGLTRKDDTFRVPEKFTKEPIGEGPYQGDVLPVEQMLDEYYRVRGWDPETGLQTKAKLEELGLHHLIPELEQVNGVR
jgi:aldehyde:ferredoxin oxidoreductase